MYQEYFRPKTVAEAVERLQRPQPSAIPLGGGTTLSHGVAVDTVLVDLQDLPLKQIIHQGNYLHIGAAVSLQMLVEHPKIPPALKTALMHETTLHLRNMATFAGSVVTADGRSPLATALLALDARLVILPGDREVSLGDWLPRRGERDPKDLITQVVIAFQPELMFEMVARSPEDRPIVCVVVAKWPSGRTRVALGGAGPAPILAMDGPESAGADAAVENAFSQASDGFASGEYRSQAARVIVTRLLALGEKQ
jgi:probable selenate reductase FAD-binding subunit